MDRSRLTKFLITYAIVMTIILLGTQLLVPKQQQAPVAATPPQVALARIEDQEKAAKDNTYKLRQVADKYTQFADEAGNKNTEDAAEARLRFGELWETKLDDEKHSGWDTAQKAYQALVKDYSPDTSKAAAEAKTRLADINKKIDQRNRTTGMGKYAYAVMDFLVNLTGRNPKYSYFLALLIITVLFKVVTLPLAHAQFKSMKEMQKVQPLLKELQAKYKDDQAELGQKTMALYKEHGVNPFTSCLPMLIQMPIMLTLYWIIRMYQYQFVHGQFLWIGSALSHQFPNIVAASLAFPDIPLLIIYTISMFIQQKFTVVDPSTAEQQKTMMLMMPLLFGYMMFRYALPSAFMLYWLFFNIFGTVQQYYVLKKPSGPDQSGGGVVAGGGPEGPSADLKTELKKLQTGPGKAKRQGKRFQARRMPGIDPSAG